MIRSSRLFVLLAASSIALGACRERRPRAGTGSRTGTDANEPDAH